MKSPRILWVDDQADVARTISGLLSPIEPRVEHARDGEAAIELLKNQWFDLAIVDLRMPPGEWGGLWLLRELQNKSGPPILVLSGEGRQRETIQAMRLGATDYVDKESVRDELLSRVAACLDEQRVSVQDLISAGEDHSCEFKASLRYSLETGAKDRRLERAILKTIAGFMNSATGGHLLIGVRDDGKPVGLEGDFTLLAKPQRDSEDSFANHLTQAVAARLGDAVSAFWTLSFPVLGDFTVCHVRCQPSPFPVYFEHDEERAFFLRANNSTRPLEGVDLERYIRSRWPGEGS